LRELSIGEGGKRKSFLKHDSRLLPLAVWAANSQAPDDGISSFGPAPAVNPGYAGKRLPPEINPEVKLANRGRKVIKSLQDW
jgi:hypothetical protein